MAVLLGFLLASLILKLDIPVGEAVPRILVTVLLAAVPLFDLALVTVARLREGRPLWKGGTDHSTHRLRARGLSNQSVAVRLIVAQAACGAVAVLVAAHSDSDAFVLVTAAVSTGLGLVLLVVFLRLRAEVPS